MSSTLPPYTGPWGEEQAAHLLRRTGFGLRPDEVTELAAMTPAAAVDRLLEERPLPAPPVNYNFTEDPNVPVGAPWDGKPLVRGVNVNGYRLQSLRAWTYDNIRRERLSVRERMCEFWNNHFGIAGGGQAQIRYDYHKLLKTHALGNFRELVQRVTVEMSMLIFLNGNQNFAASPNENYARELLELFTLGKGPQIAPGDYSTYTEQDVRALARALTGWRIRYAWNDFSRRPESYFDARRHDTGNKRLSHHFGHDVIRNGGAEEYRHVVNRIFQQPAVARHLCRKLYRHFVYYDITEAEERDVIEPLARLFEEHDFELRPVLRALFLSEHFYATDNRGPMIKNPLQFVAGAMRTFGHAHQFDGFPIDQQRRMFIFYYYAAAGMEQDYFYPPSVAGWEAYYQAPAYYRIWINSSTLQVRTRFTQTMTDAQGAGVGLGNRATYDYLSWITQVPNATDPNALIAGVTRLLLPQPLTPGQLANLKEVLIPGLPDFEWTVEYGDHLANPRDSALADSVHAKLRDLFRAIFSLAEYQLV